MAPNYLACEPFQWPLNGWTSLIEQHLMINVFLAFDLGFPWVKLLLPHLYQLAWMFLFFYVKITFFIVRNSTGMLKLVEHNCHKLPTAFIDFQQYFSSNVSSKKAKLLANWYKIWHSTFSKLKKISFTLFQNNTYWKLKPCWYEVSNNVIYF